jgi:hypothetical protein
MPVKNKGAPCNRLEIKARSRPTFFALSYRSWPPAGQWLCQVLRSRVLTRSTPADQCAMWVVSNGCSSRLAALKGIKKIFEELIPRGATMSLLPLTASSLPNATVNSPGDQNTTHPVVFASRFPLFGHNLFPLGYSSSENFAQV